MTEKTKTIQEQYDFKAIEGLHFNMSDDEYFSIPCLSASGLKMLKTNPSKFWWYSWMNPEKEEKNTEARIIGKAFHKRILEGSAAFYDAYAREFSCNDDGALITSTDIKEELQKYRHVDENIKINAKKEALIERLLHNDPNAKIYDHMKRDYEMKHAGKIFLSDWVIDRAELCAKVIENHPELKTAFIGGFAEVTCVWFDKELGVWFKCRYDYLKVSAINDLKTFSRLSDKEIERYLPDIISKYGYNIQATHYLDSMVYAKQFAKEGKVYGYEGDIKNDAWLKAFASRPCDQIHFVFQQKEEIPNAYEVVFSKNHAMYQASQAMIRHAVDEYKIYSERFGDEMWPEIKPVQVLTDDDYPQWSW